MYKILNKFAMVLANFSILVNTFLTPITVYAQDSTPTETPSEVMDSTSLTTTPAEETTTESTEPAVETTPEVTVEPTAVPSEEVGPTPAEETSPTPSEEGTPVEEGEVEGMDSTSLTTTPADETPAVEATTNEENAHVSAVVVENVEASSVTEDEVVYDGTGTPQLQTDKADYAPTDVVLISGTGFEPNKEYDLVITGTGEFRFDDKVKSDESGGLFYTYQLDGTYRPDYKVEVLDNGSTISTVTFTDSDTGFKSPTANEANDSGSGDDWTNPTNAYSNGGGAATELGDERHRFYNYVFGVPAGATIDGIEVAVDAWSTDNSGCQLGVDLSWNGGSNWSNEKTQNLTNNETTYNLGSGSDKWGSHSWVPTDFSDANFRSRVRDIDPGQNCSGNPSLDWIRIKVYYTESASQPDLVVTKTNNVGGSVTVNQEFTWTFTIQNIGSGSATFNDQDILQDDLPNSGVTFADTSNLSVTNSGGTTGSVDCDISSNTLDCDDNNGGSTVVIPAGGSFSVDVDVTPTGSGTLTNPRVAGICQVDPGNVITEIIGGNNGCLDNVEVVAPTPTPSPTPTVTPSPTPTPVANPSLPQACGLDIALILDNSTSIDSGEMTSMKNAMTAFTNALNGTPTQFSVTKFATTGSVVQAFTANIATVNAAITAIPVGGGSTNWEDGFLKGQSTFDPRVNPNLVIFASDGNPNRVDDGTSVSESQAVSEAVLVADVLKTSGTRILALGIGSDLDTPNLQAVSGPNVNTGNVLTSDVITTDFANLATQLATFASQTCGGTITAQKLIDADGNLQTTNDQTPVDDWIFDVNGAPSNPAPADTDVQGFTPAFSVDPGTYSITETPVVGYSLLSAVCTNNQQVVGSSVTNGVGSISVGVNDIVSCVFINSLSQGTITINKVLAPANDSGVFNLMINSVIYATNVGDGGTTGAISLPPGQYTLAESGVGDTNLADYSISSSEGCDDGNGTVTLSPGENIVCTITNTRKTGSVKVNKLLDNDGNGTFETVNPGAFNWNMDGQGENPMGSTVSGVVLGVHTVNENIVPGYHFVGWYPTIGDYSCTNFPEGNDTPPDSINVLYSQTTEITLCNASDTGSVKINKRVDANGDGDWNDTGEGVNGAASSGFNWNLDTVGTNAMGSTVSGVATGNHDVNENSVTGYHFTGWFVTSDTSKTCANVTNTLPANVTVVAGRTVEITLCNARDAGTIRITKDAINNNAQNFTFNTTGGTLPGSFQLDDDSNGTLPNTRLFTVPTGVYTVTEAAVSGWMLTGLECSDENNSDTDLNDRKVTLSVETGENIICTFTNTKLGSIEGVKYNDKDGDGNHDFLEPRLNGWTIFIDANDNGTLDGDELSDTTSGTVLFIFPAGEYEFNNLLPGVYKVCEVPQVGWINSTDLCQTVTVDPGENEELDFGNHGPLTLRAYKVVCETEADLPNWGDDDAPNINASTAQNFVDNSDGNCHLEEGWNFQYGFDGEVVKYGNGDQLGAAPEPWQTLGTTNGSGYAETTVASLNGADGIWVREELQEDYVPFSYPPAGPTEDPFSAEIYCHRDGDHYDNFDQVQDPKFGETYYCVAFNAPNNGDIKVCKYDDYNGDGKKDEGEPGISGVTMSLEEIYEQSEEGEALGSKDTGEDGCVLFEDLDLGSYQVNEELEDLPGYAPTADYENGTSEDPADGQIEVTVEPGQTTLVEFLNKLNPVTITLEKFADEEATGPGDIIFYTLKVKNTSDHTAYDAQVSDFTPFGFAYQTGTTEIDDAPSSDPSISGPVLTWNLGTIDPDQEVKVEYQMKAPDPLSEGTYTNIAIARAYNRPSEVEVSEEASLLDLFISEVSAISPHPAATVSESEVAFDVVRYTRGISFSASVGGQVLGTSTVLGAVLPASGSETYILLALLSTLALGVWFKYLSTKAGSKK